ncbi:MAG: TetR/AcrR family transcriptional regulator [Dehalococcoidia bacterium]|nr:TetR/AcrR family transcriptional regulator [Dehalococcoidia bacterium]
MTTGGTRAERVRAASHHRRELEKQELRRRILSAAAELFVEDGYEGFSLRRLAERIGYSPTTVYFKDKDDLLFAVCDEGFARFMARLEAGYARHTDPLDRLEALGEEYVAFGLANPAFYRMMFMRDGRYFAQRAMERGVNDSESYRLLVRAVIEAMDAGALQRGDPTVVADVVWAAMHGVVALALSMPNLSTDRVKALEAAMRRVVTAGLVPSGGESRSGG